MKKNLLSILAIFASIFLSQQAIAKEKELVFVPFYFSSDSMGSTIGLAGIAKGLGQPQATLFGMGLYSENNSYVTFLSAFNYALSPNLLLSAQIYQAQFNDNPYYLGDQGSNSSSMEDKTVTNGEAENYELKYKYLLPWGSVREEGQLGALEPIRDVRFASPIDSGVSSITFAPFYSSRELGIYNKNEEAMGFNLALEWDNRDSVHNTTRGSHTSITFTTGAESVQSEEVWFKWEFQNSQYYSLGSWEDWLDQQVLAFNFYTADTPTWNKCDSSGCVHPPEHEQVRLGGLYRLRGYNSGRYHGRSAIHYSAEYRMVPNWQPLEEIPIINYYDLPWWQWVAFVEVGRVADSYDLKTLHNDMKWNIGGAVRLQVEGVVVRAEIAKGEDEGTFRVMLNQPF